MGLIQSLPIGKTQTLIDATNGLGASTYTFPFTIDAPDAFVNFYATTIAGTITMKVYEYVGEIHEGKNRELQDFSADIISDAWISRKLGASSAQLYVELTLTDNCNFEIVVKGAAQAESSVRILGANAGRNSQTTLADGIITNVIPSALTGRAGIVIFNNSATISGYWGYTLAETTVAEGYPLLPKMALGIDMAAGSTIYMIADGGSMDLRISEASS